MYPDKNPKKRIIAKPKRRTSRNSIASEEDIRKTILAAELTMTTETWTATHTLKLGDSLETRESQALYAKFLLYRKEVEPVVKGYSTEDSTHISYLILLNNKHMLLLAQRENIDLEDLAILRFIRSNSQLKFVNAVLCELSLMTIDERLSAFADFEELLPEHTLSALNIYRLSHRYFLKEDNASWIQSLFIDWLRSIKGRIRGIVIEKQKDAPKYSPHDVLESIANSLKNYSPKIIKSLSDLLCLNMLTSEEFAGVVLSLKSHVLLESFPDRSYEGSLIARYARSFHRFWNNLGTKPDYSRIPETVSYFTSKISSIISSKTNSALYSRGSRQIVIKPKQFGLSDITDQMWDPRTINDIPSRSYYLRKMADYTSGVDDVRAVLYWLDKLQFPYHSPEASNGVLIAFSAIANRLNDEATLYHDMKRLNMLLFPASPIEDTAYKSNRIYPISVDHKSGIEPGSDYDLSKSTMLNLLAQRGLHFTPLQMKQAQTKMDRTQREYTHMPLVHIALYTNWAFGEFLCRRINQETSKYLAYESYESHIIGVHKLISSLSPFIYGVTDGESRLMVNTRGTVSNGARDIVIDQISVLLSENIPFWDALQECHRKELTSILTDYVDRRFPVDKRLTDVFNLFDNTYTPQADRQNQENNISSRNKKREHRPVGDMTPPHNRKRGNRSRAN